MPRPSETNFSGSFQELHHFLQIVLGFFGAYHVFERHRGMLAGEHARAALAKRHRLVVGALRLPEHEVDQAHYDQAGQQKADCAEQRAPFRRPIDHVLDRGQFGGVDPQALQLRSQIRVGILVRRDNFAAGIHLDIIARDDDLLDFTGSDQGGHLTQRHVCTGLRIAAQRREDDRADSDDDQQIDQIVSWTSSIHSKPPEKPKLLSAAEIIPQFTRCRY
jgi:hypothetical protein